VIARLALRVTADEGFQGLVGVGALMGLVCWLGSLVIAGLGGGAYWVGVAFIALFLGFFPALVWMSLVAVEVRANHRCSPQSVPHVKRGIDAWAALPATLRVDTADLVEDLRRAGLVAASDPGSPYLLARVAARADALEKLLDASRRLEANLHEDEALRQARGWVKVLDEVNREQIEGR
jgi:hypothetical protein